MLEMQKATSKVFEVGPSVSIRAVLIAESFSPEVSKKWPRAQMWPLRSLYLASGKALVPYESLALLPLQA